MYVESLVELNTSDPKVINLYDVTKDHTQEYMELRSLVEKLGIPFDEYNEQELSPFCIGAHEPKVASLLLLFGTKSQGVFVVEYPEAKEWLESVTTDSVVYDDFDVRMIAHLRRCLNEARIESESLWWKKVKRGVLLFDEIIDGGYYTDDEGVRISDDDYDEDRESDSMLDSLSRRYYLLSEIYEECLEKLYRFLVPTWRFPHEPGESAPNAPGNQTESSESGAFLSKPDELPF